MKSYIKIGIVTFWDSHENYGQILQCYALQKYLRINDFDPCLIRYLPRKDSPKKQDLIYKCLNPFYVYNYIAYRSKLKRERIFDLAHQRGFSEFKKQYIKSTERIYNGFEELLDENWDLEVCICGSDQIWRYDNNTSNIKGYFLNFIPKNIKKIAYAASFGRTDIPSDFRKILPNLISDFHALGLRENTGIKLCEDAGRKDAFLVCDPTLLLRNNDYIEDIIKEDIVNKKSCFCYFLNWDTLISEKKINDFVDENQLTMEFFPTHGSQYIYPFDIANDLSISNWLKSIASSEVVFTNSFHGTVFAILFKRNFIVFPLEGESKGMNDRLFSLLNLLGLENRIYYMDMNLKDVLSSNIDWNEIDKKLENYRLFSRNFLLSSLKD